MAQAVQPEWLGPPAGELGGVVPLGLVLARSELGVVALSHAIAYSTGVAFDLVAQAGGLTPRSAQGVLHDQHAGRLAGDELPEGFLRLGIELPDGPRVANVGSQWPHLRPTDSPSGPLLIQRAGGGGQTGKSTVSWNVSYWLWPLPGEGVLQITCEWPIAGIPVSTSELATAELLTTSAKAARIFDERDAEPSVGSASTQFVVATAARATSSAEADESGGALDDVAAELRRAQRSLARALASLERLRQ